MNQNLRYLLASRRYTPFTLVRFKLRLSRKRSWKAYVLNCDQRGSFTVFAVHLRFTVVLRTAARTACAWNGY